MKTLRMVRERLENLLERRGEQVLFAVAALFLLSLVLIS